MEAHGDKKNTLRVPCTDEKIFRQSQSLFIFLKAFILASSHSSICLKHS